MEEKREGNKKVRSGFMEEKCPGEEILPGCQGWEGACYHIHLSIAGRLDRQVPALSSFAARDFEKGKAPCSGLSSTGRNVADSPTIRHVSYCLYHLIVPLSGRFSVLLCFMLCQRSNRLYSLASISFYIGGLYWFCTHPDLDQR